MPRPGGGGWGSGPGDRHLGPLLLVLAAVVGLTGCEPQADPAPPHVVIVVVDTLRADAVDLEDVDAPGAFFRRFAETATVYHQARANAPWTLPSHASMLTGLLPSSHNVHWRSRKLDAAHRTLAERLAEAGYGSLALVENAWLLPRFGVTRGFEEVRLTKADYFDRVEPDGDDIVTTLDGLVDELDWSRPQLLLVNIVDVHAPYGVGLGQHEISEPSRYLCREYEGREEDLATLRRLYRLDVERAAKKVGLLLDSVGRAIDLGEALIVLVSDHGEHLGEQGIVSHHFSVYESLLRVPLMVHKPGQTRRRDVHVPVSLVDLTPSILAAAGLAASGTDGVDILGRARPHPHFAEYVEPDPGDGGTDQWWIKLTDEIRRHCEPGSAFHGDFFAVVDRDLKMISASDGRRMLFDLAADADESVDLAARDAERLARLQELLPRTRVADVGEEGEPPIDDELLERLRTLGYIDG